MGLFSGQSLYWLDDFMLTMARKTWASKSRMVFYRRLAAMVENGLLLSRSARVLAKRSGERLSAWKYDPEVMALSEIATRLENGVPLHRALAGWAKPSELSIIAAGVKSGELPAALRMVLDSGRTVAKLRNRMIAEMWEPLLLGSVGAYLVYIVGTKMVPSMEAVVPAVRWPVSARMLLPMAWVTTSGIGLILVATMMLLIVVIFMTMSRWSGGWRKYFDKVPPWSVYRVLQGSAWIVGFTNLISAGEKMEAALAIQADMAPRWLKDRLLAARMRVINGAELGAALQKTGYDFPDLMLIQDISTYSGFADFPKLLRKLGDEWMQENEEKIIAALKMLGSMVNMFVNVVILLVVIGMNSLQGLISSGAHP